MPLSSDKGIVVRKFVAGFDLPFVKKFFSIS